MLPGSFRGDAMYTRHALKSTKEITDYELKYVP